MTSRDEVRERFHGLRPSRPGRRFRGLGDIGVIAILACSIALGGLVVLVPPAAATDVPAWTYLKKEFGARADPVSVIVFADLSAASASLQSVGWQRTTCGYTEYIHYKGTWRGQNLMLEKDSQGWCGILGTRKHARLWQLEVSLVILAVHIDHTHWNGHQVHDYEGVEGVVAHDFRTATDRSWQVAEDAHAMDNVVSYYHGRLLVVNDGSSTQVSLGAALTLVSAGGLDGTRAGAIRIAPRLEFPPHRPALRDV